jgi:hypothetical protein
MGGSGSGSWYRQNPKEVVESYRRVDVRDLKRQEVLGFTGYFSWCWWNSAGEKAADINVRSEPDRLILEYRYRPSGGEWEDVEEPIQITNTACRYGGIRPWFVCPGPSCGRRVAILFVAGRYFLCRHCYDLTYSSRREGHADRALRRVQEIRLRLSGSASLKDPFPKKPKRMRWKTYSQLWAKAQKAEGEWYDGLAEWLGAPRLQGP